MSATQHRRHAPRAVRVAVITVSDTRTEADDESGDLMVQLLEAHGHTVTARRVVRDEERAIRAAVEEALGSDAQAVLLNGGTGISPRDVTIETVAPLLAKELPGFGELFRALSFQHIGPAAMMSRAVGGLAQGKAVFALPGSPAAVRLAMERLLLPELGHLVGEAAKGTGRDGDPLAGLRGSAAGAPR